MKVHLIWPLCGQNFHKLRALRKGLNVKPPGSITDTHFRAYSIHWYIYYILLKIIWNLPLYFLWGSFFKEHRKEGVPQGDPLAMIIYGIVVLPITRIPQNHLQDMEWQRWRDKLQVWYADDLALASNFSCIKAWFYKMLWIRNSLGYHPKPDRGFLITSEENTVLSISHFHEEGF